MTDALANKLIPTAENITSLNAQAIITHLFVAGLTLTQKLETELTAVTEQRDDFRKEVEIANERLRGKKHPDDNGLTVDGEIDIKQLKEQRDRLTEAIRLTLMDNLDLCDGDVCTLKRLKDAIGFDLDHNETTP